MTVEAFRGYVAAVVAGVVVMGGAVAVLWAIANITDPDARTLAVGVLSGLIGSAATFLFVQESASRAAHAAERAALIPTVTEPEVDEQPV